MFALHVEAMRRFTPAITSRRVNAPPEKPRFAARLALPRLLDAARIPGKQSPQGRGNRHEAEANDAI